MWKPITFKRKPAKIKFLGVCYVFLVEVAGKKTIVHLRKGVKMT